MNTYARYREKRLHGSIDLDTESVKPPICSFTTTNSNIYNRVLLLAKLIVANRALDFFFRSQNNIISQNENVKIVNCLRGFVLTINRVFVVFLKISFQKL